MKIDRFVHSNMHGRQNYRLIVDDETYMAVKSLINYPVDRVTII